LNFYIRHNVQTGSEAHPASYSMRTGVISLGIKWPGREADHLHHLVPRSRMRGAIPPLPNTLSWRGAWLSTGTVLPLKSIRGCIQKFPDWPPGVRTANGAAL